MRTAPTFTIAAAALAVATIAAMGLLTLAAADTRSMTAWIHVPIPLLLAAGAGYQAAKAGRRGEAQSAAALLGSGIMANAYVAFLAGHLGA